MFVIPRLWQFLHAIFADAEVTGLIVVDASIEDGGVHATDVAYVLEIDILEEGKFMSNGACLFSAGWHTTLDAVLFIAFPADGTAEFGLKALRANRRNHFIILSNEELEVVLLRASVLLLQSVLRPLLAGSEGTGLVVLVELLD
jgi:hypothetical protein